MNRKIYLLSAITMVLMACSSNEFKKAKDGSEYKIISDGKGSKAVAGNFMQLNVLAKYKDSVLFNSFENGSPVFMPYDTAQLPPFFKDIHEGDSMIIRMSTDTLIKKGQSAPFMKKGEHIYQHFKVVKLFATKEQADSVAKIYEPIAKERARKRTMEQIQKFLGDNAAQLNVDDKILADYISAKKIAAVKAPWGTYVAISAPGTGENISDTSVAVVRYTGRTLADTVFDSNIDPKFGHPQPINVDMSQIGSVILGWNDGLKMLKKGSKAKFLIPSILGYGKNGNGDKIKANENLIFDIEVVDIISSAQYMAEQMEMQRKQMEMQRMMQEQMQKQQQQQQQAPQQQK
ncbi:MAG TPA: FKBP-type peptidyl-prolyl cis-trans isomerase [Chitinophagaceae bacterium]|nr:FKBP-type peptidyl-prolyl cis-trans isomerase [Chitinophagaceae bacterium]